MSQRVEYTWKSLAEASEEATRKFTWIAAGLFLACSVLAYVSISTHLRYSEACEYIDSYALAAAAQAVEESELAAALLRNYCG